MNPLQKTWQLVTHLGPGWVVFRLRYALRRKSGVLVRRTPVGEWEMRRPEAGVADHLPRWFASRPVAGEGSAREAEEILGGRFRLFSRHVREVGAEPDWSENPLTGEKAPSDRHWSRIGDFGHGDIKGVWELSRFTWAWPLARAYTRTADERWAERFWTLLEHWMAHNKPNRGANWMCGQEATFRLMAATFARFAFAGAKATTSERLERFRALVLATGRRIAANLDYALSQSNNHGVSECVGLITAGLLAPDAPESAGWSRRGLRALREQLAALVYPDGAFAQHSATYHRVLLHDLLWCVQGMRSANVPVPDWLEDAGQRAVGFADHLLAPTTGHVPLYGANDGANILPLADGDYLDFRPVVQAGYAVFFGRRRLPPGPWDEAAWWLAGAEGWAENDSAPRPAVSHLRDGGCLLWRHGAARLFLRCPESFRHRPSQADLLHVDVEWRGQPVAIDAGTFSYNAKGAFSGALKEAQFHNSLTLDGGEPLAKVGRFLYLPWPKGAAAMHRDAAGEYFSATHDGWSGSGAAHVRECRPGAEDEFVVVDRLRKQGSGVVRLHWLLADHPYVLDEKAGQLWLQTPAGRYGVQWGLKDRPSRVTVVRADPETARGWWSPYYACAAPALSLTIEFEFSGEAEIQTRFGPAPRR